MNITTQYSIDQRVFFLKQNSQKLGDISISSGKIVKISITRNQIFYQLSWLNDDEEGEGGLWSCDEEEYKDNDNILEKYLFTDEIELMKFFKTNLRAKIKKCKEDTDLPF